MYLVSGLGRFGDGYLNEFAGVLLFHKNCLSQINILENLVKVNEINSTMEFGKFVYDFFIYIFICHFLFVYSSLNCFLN